MAGRRRLLAVLVTTLALVAILLAAEILVRALTRYNTPDTVRLHSLQYRPSIFARHRLAPNQRVEVDRAWDDSGVEGGTGRVYAINEAGYRGASFPLEKPPDTCRIVVLGGSAVFDLMATEGLDWPHRLGTLLADGGRRKVEVINGGVPGHASFDSLGRLYSQVWMYEPDYVLIYHAWNDIKYFKDLERARPLLSSMEPYREGGDPFRSYAGGLDRLLSHSQLYVKLRTRYLIWRWAPGAEGAVSGGELSASYDSLGPRQFSLDLELLVDAARNIGAQPILLTQASLVSERASPEDRARIAYEYQGLTHEALVRAFDDCNDAVRAVAQSKDAELVDLAKILGGRSELFEDHVHLNARGSAEIADVLARHLVGQIDERCGAATGGGLASPQ